MENNPYDPSLMVFMDYRDYAKQEVPCLEAQYPTFLYAMPMSSTKVFFEVCAMQLIFYIVHVVYHDYMQNDLKSCSAGNLFGFKRCHAF